VSRSPELAAREAAILTAMVGDMRVGLTGMRDARRILLDPNRCTSTRDGSDPEVRRREALAKIESVLEQWQGAMVVAVGMRADALRRAWRPLPLYRPASRVRSPRRRWRCRARGRRAPPGRPERPASPLGAAA
jgi:hypothetical protein